jgi:osmotically-inducible protein OsmY
MILKQNSYPPASATKTRSWRLFPVLTIYLVSALSGCATIEKCHSSACSDDARITAELQYKFQQHAELDAPNSVTVQTVKHVVYLDGWVSAGLQREIAGSLAMEAPGVERVVNLITVTH